MFRYSRIPCVAMLALLSCSKPMNPPPIAQAEGNRETTDVKTLIQDADVLTLNENPEVLPLLNDYRFGKFFEDRAEFFVIPNSTSKILGSPVKTIVLYYLDDRHCQSKFFLSGNISNELIARYGKFRIAPLDHENNERLKRGPVLVKENERTILNKALTRVELSWVLADKVIRFRVDLQEKSDQFIYTEHIPDYEQVFRAVEKASL
jgi:hypothetical protein